MAQEAELAKSVENLKALLDGMRIVERKYLKGLADLPNMSIDHIELLLVSYCPGPSRKNAILLKRLFDEYKEIDNGKLVRNRIQHSKRFTLFPKLPPELRRCIWNQALPGPQVIELYHHKMVNGLDRIEVATSSQVRLVRLMKVCHEAKETVKSNFRSVDARAFGVQTLPIGATILVNYFQDVLNLDGRNMLDSFLRGSHSDTRLGAEELANIQNLAVQSWELDGLAFTNNIGTLARLKSLKELLVVVRETRQASARRDHCRRNLQIRLCTPRSDHQHITKMVERKWSHALETGYGSRHLACLEMKFRTMHIAKDKRNPPVLVCPIIQDEIHRMVLLQQVQTPQSIIQLTLI
jgi:hypothetical protein